VPGIFKTFIIISFAFYANTSQSSSFVNPIFAGSNASNSNASNSLLNYKEIIHLPNNALKPMLLKLYLLLPYFKHIILIGFIGKKAPFLNLSKALELV